MSTIRRQWFCIAIIAVAAVSAASAGAQSNCEEGRVEVSGGYCCWPGQTFDESASRCSGPPSCPENRVARGADCDLTSPPSAAPRAEPQGAAAERDWGLIGAGIGLIGGGYVGAALTSVVSGQQTARGSAGRTTPVPNWPLGFVPVVHALAAIGSCCGSYDVPVIIAGIAGGLMEVVGLVLVILGVIGNEEPSETALRLGPVELRLGAVGAEVGLSAALAF